MSVQESKRNLKEYFAKSFNDQFAVNQNTQFTLLTTITVSLATVIAGLGYDRFPFYHFNWMPNHYAFITRIVLILLLMINIQFAAFLWNGGLIFHYNATIDFNLIALGIWPPLLFFLAILTPAYYRIWFNEHHLNRKPKGRIERLILSIGKHIP